MHDSNCDITLHSSLFIKKDDEAWTFYDHDSSYTVREIGATYVQENVQTIFDRPLSEMNAKETSIEEEETNGSTEPTE